MDHCLIIDRSAAGSPVSLNAPLWGWLYICGASIHLRLRDAATAPDPPGTDPHRAGR